MIADTSFLVALFIEEDELHNEALNELENNKEELTIPDRVIEETFTVLNYKKGIDYALGILQKLDNNKDINIKSYNEKEWNSIIQLISKVRKKLSFVDYTIIYECLRTNEKLLCFDKEIIKTIKSFR